MLSDGQKARLHALRVFDQLTKLLRRFPSSAWVHLIAQYDWDPRQKTKGDRIHWLAPALQPHVRIGLTHFSLRCSTDSRTAHREISYREFARAAYLFIEADCRATEIADDPGLKNALYYCIGPMAYDQFGRDLHPHNIVARTSVLLKRHEEIIYARWGMSLATIISMAFRLMAAAHWNHSRPILKEVFGRTLVDFCSQDQFDSFLRVFCVTPEQYKKIAIHESSSYINRNEFPLIVKYPILETAGGYLSVPVGLCIINAVTRNLYHYVLNFLENEKERNEFFIKFGEDFEDYVRHLLKSASVDVKECCEITGIKNKKNEKCAEFYIECERDLLVVECKRFAFGRDTMSSGSPSAILADLEKHIPKAVEQIRNSLHWLGNAEGIGLIITYDYIPLANCSDFPIAMPKNTIVMSIDDFEILVTQPIEMVFGMLRSFIALPDQDRGDFRAMWTNNSNKERLKNKYLWELAKPLLFT